MSEKGSGGGLGIFGIVFIVFLTLKLLEVAPVATWSWWLVMSPLGAAVAFALIVGITKGFAYEPK